MSASIILRDGLPVDCRWHSVGETYNQSRNSDEKNTAFHLPPLPLCPHDQTLHQMMLTEEVDEGLVLLGKILGWDPIDLTYTSLLETREGALRWDDKPLKKAPKPSELDRDVSVHVYLCVCVFVLWERGLGKS